MGDEGWFFLDFDDFVIGPAGPRRLDAGPRARRRSRRASARLLIEAYRAVPRLRSAAGCDLVEPLRGFRFVFYAGWIAKRWEDPAFPSAFPHFGTDEYWENETRDLEELVRRLASGDDLIAPEEREERRSADGDAGAHEQGFLLGSLARAGLISGWGLFGPRAQWRGSWSTTRSRR